jgi:small subunit ribosomal protein S8
MAVSDPIADMLTRIRNALAVRHDSVLVPASKVKLALAKILKDEGFILGFDSVRSSTPQNMIKVALKYGERSDPTITGLKRVSKPGLRVYVQKNKIPRYYGGLGVAVVSTSQGIMTGHQAWRKGLGGELLCYVW